MHFAIRRKHAPVLSELVGAYLVRLAAANRRPDTIDWYRKRLGRLIRFLHDTPAAQISRDGLAAFLLAVKQGTEHPNSDAYTESHRRAFAIFFSWAVAEGHLGVSPMERVEPFRVDEAPIDVLEPAEVSRLMAAQSRRTFLGVRNRAAIALLYDTGLRVGELVRLELRDVDLDRATLTVSSRAKGRRGRVVPISPTLRSILYDYLHFWRMPGHLAIDLLPAREHSPVLFVSAEGAALATTAVNQWMRRAAQRAGLTGKRVSPHVFRHSFATAYLRNGGDEFTLQKMLGHSTRAMTARYVHMLQADVARVHAIASPLERLAAGG